MKITQTLWTNKRSLLRESFGWAAPMYHAMSWTLSCLRLREYYDDVHLYTDSSGKAMLIDYLHLPYSHVHVSYDNRDDWNGTFWALPKIATYGLQDSPFIHVDGDVFIWERFGADLENAPLVAQNLEVGTSCYREKMDGMAPTLDFIPEVLEEDIVRQSIPSYNAGILGGHDIAFFKEYTQLALEMVKNNYQHEKKKKATIDFNILFEQILFYSMSSRQNKNVACYFKEPIDDNGYTKDFFDFESVPHRSKYLHLIGGHKKNYDACMLMSKVLFLNYPEYFFRITALFGTMKKKFAQC